jgi:uncharacterized protein
MKKIFTLLFLQIAFFVTVAQRDVPELWGMRVHDEAGVLSTSTVQLLEHQLKMHEDSTSNQIAILIISSLQGEAIEDYSLKVAEKWQLGQKGKDNGILLLIAIDDRKMRIEVGYGLEGVLPDAICNRIIRNEMAPNFRRGDYDAGVQTAINAIIDAIAGEYTVSNMLSNDEGVLSGKEMILIGLFVIGILGIFTFAGLATQGCAGWFLYAFLVPFYAIFPGAIFGWNTGLTILIAYLIGFPILKFLFKKKGWDKKFASSGGGGWSSGSGWSGGGWSGGGGWSSGGGGFSGGGGGFGGGGSSGSW